MSAPEFAAGGVLATAVLLGATHAVEPDHVAGIVALTADAANARLSALAGACFAVGHVALVALWVGFGTLLLDAVASDLPPGVARVGTLALGATLALLGAGMGYLGFRRLWRERPHYHADSGTHSHGVLALPGHADHGHDAVSYLKIGLVGALFTLSPPVTMLAFISGVASEVGLGATPLAILAYAVGIVGVMTAIGTGAGAAFRLVNRRGARVHALAQVISAAFVTGFGLSFLWRVL
ncbi:MAG: hypothetical protein ABEJ06_04695 [Haloarculaceae archaeon]